MRRVPGLGGGTMFIKDTAIKAGPEAARRQYLAVFQHALENCPLARTGAVAMVEQLGKGALPTVDLVFMVNAGPEARVVSDAVVHLVSGGGFAKGSKVNDVTLARHTWPTLTRTNVSPRGVAVFEEAERLNATVARAWLTEHLKTDRGEATVFFTLDGPEHRHLDFINTLRVFARQQGARVGIRVLDFTPSDDD